jgi:hypothetical protein
VNSLRWFAWHTLVVVALLGLVASRYGGPVWQLSPNRLLFAILLAAGYLLAAIVLHLDPPGTGAGGLVRVTRATLAGYAMPFLTVIAMDVPVSRFAAGVGLVFGGVALAVPFLLPRLMTGGLALLTPLSLGLLYLTSTSAFTLTQPRVRSIAVSEIITSLVSVEATLYRHYLPHTESPYAGGGIAAVGDEHLIVTADGDIHAVSWSTSGEPQVRALPTRAPLDRPASARSRGTATSPSGSGSWTWRRDGAARRRSCTSPTTRGRTTRRASSSASPAWWEGSPR